MEMGFEEMPTNKWVESSFWNFDALFQPQSHPARDAHDTFFMKEPMFANSVPEDYYEVDQSMSFILPSVYPHMHLIPYITSV
jgi:phenylalanyl-tRNA synthetase alpha chain